MTDGQAALDEEAAAGKHLARCPACRAAGEQMAAATRLLRVRPAQPCRDFLPDLMAVFDAQVAGRHGTAAGVVELLTSAVDRERHRSRPRCVPDHIPVWRVGTERCGCVAGCACGCQEGAPCQCHASVA
ncbi:hypothetical protein [Amycolatopsis sulphurea]|uniref:hypothetical protein n=1 Tax=Amycolatopsis sulphurea TaxID=76022 RepID=UPI001145E765|nr:hypothetical protein [Amycolatopsis sulphurea]